MEKTMRKTKIEKLDALIMGGFLGGVDTVKYNKEDINFLHRALIYVYDKQVEIIDYLNQDQPEEEKKDWRKELEKVVVKRWGEEYIGTHPYCEMYDIVEGFIEQVEQEAEERGRGEIIQLLKDKKKLEDWLEEKSKLTK